MGARRTGNGRHLRTATTHARGFTLIEVLAALALMAITFAVLLQALGASMHLGSNADDRTQAALWAQTKMDSISRADPPQPGITHGRFDARFRWQLDVQPWQPPLPRPSLQQDPPTPTSGGLHLYRFDLAVSWGSGPRQRTAHFVTLRAVDAALDAAGKVP